MTEDTRQRAAGEIMGRSQKVDIAVNVSFGAGSGHGTQKRFRTWYTLLLWWPDSEMS
jgi:hypothetical protein